MTHEAITSPPSRLVLPLPEQITQRNATALLQDLLAQFARAAPAAASLHVDAGALAQFDSSALALLLALRRQAHSQQRVFSVQHLPQGLRALAQVYGIDSLLEPDSATA